jgi:hypothetical protein
MRMIDAIADDERIGTRGPGASSGDLQDRRAAVSGSDAMV